MVGFFVGLGDLDKLLLYFSSFRSTIYFFSKDVLMIFCSFSSSSCANLYFVMSFSFVLLAISISFSFKLVSNYLTLPCSIVIFSLNSFISSTLTFTSSFALLSISTLRVATSVYNCPTCAFKSFVAFSLLIASSFSLRISASFFLISYSRYSSSYLH